jgi:membrane-associated phospholipid phosphatase
MFKIIQENKLYFIVYFFLFLSVFFWQLRHEMLDAFLYFSQHRSPFNDTFFRNWTRLGEEYPFIIFAIFFVIIGEKAWTWQFVVGGLAVLTVSLGLKELFAVPRPILMIEAMNRVADIKFVEGVTLLSGQTSFPSGHSSGAFCVWTLLALRFSGNQIAQFLCLMTAVLVCVSRVYLVQHFPEDTLFGSVIGITVATIVHHYLKEKEVIGVNKTKVIAVRTIKPDAD